MHVSSAQSFTRNIAPAVRTELTLAKQARLAQAPDKEFSHLENAHILGQESTYWHVSVHIRMALWACRNYSAREFLGQLVRIIGAASKTFLGWVPAGNTGGANVSPFQAMAIPPELKTQIDKAKSPKV